jgi:uncharacterized protein CbrC (UPF0167 family)
MPKPKAIYYVSFKLKKGVSELDFLLAAEKLNNEFISHQKGYVSWKQLNDGNTWVDLITFKTMEELNDFKELSKKPNALAKKFYSFINPFSCKVRIYFVEKEYSQKLKGGK